MIELVPMSEESFQKGFKTWIETYADEKVKSGNWDAEGALERSRLEYGKLLPDGRKTKGQYVMTIRNESERTDVGMLWFGILKEGDLQGAYIWDFRIEDEHRGKGYGKQALAVLDKMLRKLGIERVSLHVFGHNRIAISLYEKMGYEITNVVMSKKLE